MKEQDPSKCPFRVGQKVIYRPSSRGKALNVMADESGQLQDGKVYEIERIIDARYVVVKGYQHPGGGLYWTEFSEQ